MRFGDRATFYTLIQSQLTRPLPGESAQEALAIVGRRVFKSPAAHAKQAAVTLVIYPHESTYRLAYIQRTHHEKDRHSGQISFPGGQVDPTDASYQAAAIRELEEETGIIVNSNQVLGALSWMYIPVSNFQVFPFVIGLDEKPAIFKQDDEVAEIFGYDIDGLLDMPIRRKEIQGRGFTVKEAPYFDLDGRTLWGATAMITNEFLEVIRAMQLDELG